jgi:hypothetical protein
MTLNRSFRLTSRFKTPGSIHRSAPAGGSIAFEITAARQARDLRSGSRLLLFDLATDFGTEITKFNNFPTELLGGLKSVIDSTPIGTALSELDVATIFDAARQGKVGKALATVTLGVGLAAVGTAIPIVGQIGAAVAALAAGIVKIIKSQKAKQDKNDAAVREALYRSFPRFRPRTALPTPGSSRIRCAPSCRRKTGRPFSCRALRGVGRHRTRQGLRIRTGQGRILER